MDFKRIKYEERKMQNKYTKIPKEEFQIRKLQEAFIKGLQYI